MVIKEVTANKLDELDLFCKKSKKNDLGYKNKLKWIMKRFKEGLKFKLLMVKEPKGMTSRGFVEYIPGEYNWRGIDADGWMVIHCLWVVGKHKKKGHGTKLLKECIKDAQQAGMHGVAVMTAGKGGWLPKKNLFLKRGFQLVEEFPPFFELYALPFSDDAPLPKFRSPTDDAIERYPSEGITLLNSCQCPYIQNTINYIEEYLKDKDIPFRVQVVEDCKEISALHPFGTYSLLGNGEFLSYKPGEAKATVKLLQEKFSN